ncbi:MAG: SulP family inorganic anion transporter [Spirochaetota bacterium]
MIRTQRFSNFSPLPDMFGGITAAVISLPLALTFGTVSGLGPEAGVYGAIAVGLTAALFGGTRTLISEPTGPMTVMMTAIVARTAAMDPEHGLELALAVVVLAGAFQILFGKLRLGRYITMMPYGVISGFMSGIGVLLVIQQLPAVFGSQDFTGLPNIIRTESLNMVFGLGALGLLLFLPRSIRRYVPPQLLVLVAALVAIMLLPQTAGIQTLGDVRIGFPRLRIPVPAWEHVGPLLVDALLLGLLGSIDTLLTATIADNLTRTHHDSDRELIGQGLGNLASGLVGGLPGAGATMGTVVSIQTGARSPAVGIVRAMMLFLAVAVFGPVISLIPTAVLAAIAVKVGIDILDWSFIGRAHRISRSTTIIMYVVMGLTVFIDLIVAVGVGIFVANILTIERLSKISSARSTSVGVTGDPVQLAPDEQQILDAADGQIMILELNGPMIFGVAGAISREIAAIDHDVSTLILDLESVGYIDTTISLLLENLAYSAKTNGSEILVVTPHDQVAQKLSKLPVFSDKVRTFPTRREALQSASEQLTPAEPTPSAP